MTDVSTPANQKIIRIRREYNAWVADESLEDYALRYTPQTFRKWSEWKVANTALGGISFLALEAIGAVMALNYGRILAMGTASEVQGDPEVISRISYGRTGKDEVFDLPGVVSRKKQLIPYLTSIVKELAADGVRPSSGTRTPFGRGHG